MTIAQAERFYEQDKKKYEISKNKELLTWLKTSIKNGYHSYMNVENLQELINNITYWYEVKYPDREMEYNGGTRFLDFEEIENISQYMNMKQLLWRLPNNQMSLLKCDYRACGGGLATIYNENGEEIGDKVVLYITIRKKDTQAFHYSWDSHLPDFHLTVNPNNGQVEVDYDLEKYITDKTITLDELLVIFKEKYDYEFNLTELEYSVNDHNFDMELRRKILELVALKLLYSHNTIPEFGYKRAKKFIDEFNKEFGLDISAEEIDEIINRDYTNGERWETVVKTYVDSDGEEQTYQTVEDVSKKDLNCFGRVKKLAKSIFKTKK